MTSIWTDERTNERTNGRSNKQTNEQTDGLWHSYGRTNEWTNQQTKERTNEKTDRLWHPYGRTNERTNKRTNNPTNERTTEWKNRQIMTSIWRDELVNCFFFRLFSRGSPWLEQHLGLKTIQTLLSNYHLGNKKVKTSFSFKFVFKGYGMMKFFYN